MPPKQVTDPTVFRVVMLKELLKKKGISVTGTKTELIARLDEADPTREWMKEIDYDSENLDLNDAGGAGSGSGLSNEEVELLRREKEVAERELRSLQQQLLASRGNNTQSLNDVRVAQGTDKTEELMRQKMELYRREKEVAELELSVMRQQLQNLRSTNNTGNLETSSVQNTRDRVNLSELKELINIFDGSDGEYANWEKQIKYVKSTYNLSEEKTKVVLSARLKGKALEWFHSQPQS